MNQKKQELMQKLSACWISCMAFMVQGNLGLLNFAHALTALRSSAGAVILYIISTRIFKRLNPVQESALLAVVMSLSDVLVHPTHFGDWYTEAIATGIAAGVINYLLVSLYTSKRQ
jgi:hypothetical protein